MCIALSLISDIAKIAVKLHLYFYEAISKLAITCLKNSKQLIQIIARSIEVNDKLFELKYHKSQPEIMKSKN